MAQDFYAAFKLGEDNQHISTVDADGVALAAIQGLYQLVQEKDARISALEGRIQALEGTGAMKSEAGDLFSTGNLMNWVFLAGVMLIGVVSPVVYSRIQKREL